MILVLGGTKSGKSSFASARAAGREVIGPVTYLATALAGDGEMKERIARHQAVRPASWTTIEEPLDPAGVFSRLAAQNPMSPGSSTILLDCITLWLTNLLSPLGEEPDRTEAMEIGTGEARRLAEAIRNWEEPGTAGTLGTASQPSQPNREAIVISNLVENGLISPWPLGRIFQDLAGLTHQMLAAAADEVFLMTAGLPQRIK